MKRGGAYKRRASRRWSASAVRHVIESISFRPPDKPGGKSWLNPDRRWRWPKFWRFCLVTALLIFIDQYWLSPQAAMERLSLLGLDVFQDFNERKPARYTRIVGILPDDYENYFNNSSPLDPAKLDNLLSAVAAACPAVIGVDIITDDARYQKVKYQSAVLKVPIVWARTLEEQYPAPKKLSGWRQGPVLGRSFTGAETGINFGLAAAAIDADRVFRRRYRTFSLSANRDPTAAFHWAIVRKYCEDWSTQPRPESCEAISKIRMEDLAKDPDRYPNAVSHVFRERPELEPFAAEPIIQTAPANPQSCPAGIESGVAPNDLTGKIVLIGGYYGGDWHSTPLGERVAGVTIIADQIEAELSQERLVEPAAWMTIVLDIALAGLLFYIYNTFRPLIAFRMAAGIAAGVLIASFFAFKFGTIWLNFVPIVVGDWLELSYEGHALADELFEQVQSKATEAQLTRTEVYLGADSLEHAAHWEGPEEDRGRLGRRHV